jgi:hypothetical protein
LQLPPFATVVFAPGPSGFALPWAAGANATNEERPTNAIERNFFIGH